jgi:hypothetical protein
MPVVLAVLIVASCSRTGLEPGTSPQRSPPAPSVEAIATIQELMEYEIDPAADALWGSVGTITTREGIEERQPHSEDEWKALRRDAIVLMEATNLLMMKGRDVARVEFPSDGPGVYSSREIQEKLNTDRIQFEALATSLRAVGRQALSAIDARDPVALQQVGEAMDGVCEACHIANWYPHQVIPPLPLPAARGRSQPM